MQYRCMPIEAESPEEYGYERIAHNLSESSVPDAHLRDLKLDLQDLILLYGEHRGLRALREQIALMYPGIEADDVLVTPGAAAALFILHTVLLQKGDHLVVQHPNYSTNLETPRAIGCELTRWRLGFEQGFAADPAWLDGQIRMNTRLISLTTPHNPSGQVMPPPELEAVVERVLSSPAHLLVDETYRDICYVAQAPLAASFDPRVISVSSLSKAYGLPGIRIGWIICQDRALLERCLAAKEQILICNSVVDEHIALQVLQQRESWLERMRGRAVAHLDILRDWMQRQAWLEWNEPEGGVVCFPRFCAAQREANGLDARLQRFYQLLLNEHGTFVGPGHWFEMPDSYLRIGYAWPEPDSLKAGLAAIEAAAATAWA
ncbi:MAG: aspartate aminotransferase [Candidatus Melainabacteria bacterium HGW-Melainabacteria-1]|nr:MAG: aspartate aminotransferase [Candidatus Melainabacteria bacterium HGW-Melainabacteria-1]